MLGRHRNLAVLIQKTMLVQSRHGQVEIEKLPEYQYLAAVSRMTCDSMKTHHIFCLQPVLKGVEWIIHPR
jgi:hypothetical protein